MHLCDAEPMLRGGMPVLYAEKGAAWPREDGRAAHRASSKLWVSAPERLCEPSENLSFTLQAWLQEFAWTRAALPTARAHRNAQLLGLAAAGGRGWLERAARQLLRALVPVLGEVCGQGVASCRNTIMCACVCGSAFLDPVKA